MIANWICRTQDAHLEAPGHLECRPVTHRPRAARIQLLGPQAPHLQNVLQLGSLPHPGPGNAELRPSVKLWPQVPSDGQQGSETALLSLMGRRAHLPTALTSKFLFPCL